MARGELCAWGSCRGLRCWLVASVLDALVLRPSLAADLVQVSAAVPVAHAGVVSRALSPAQV